MLLLLVERFISPSVRKAEIKEGAMVATFRALLATKSNGRQSVAIAELTEADLMEGNVTVAVEHTTVNYKDGLAITGKAPIIRKFPLIPGIDLAGRVLRSGDPRFQMGDRVVLNGYGLGEVHHGGYAERARVKGDWLILLPENISTASAMAIGMPIRSGRTGCCNPYRSCAVVVASRGALKATSSPL